MNLLEDYEKAVQNLFGYKLLCEIDLINRHILEEDLPTVEFHKPTPVVTTGSFKHDNGVIVEEYSPSDDIYKSMFGGRDRFGVYDEYMEFRGYIPSDNIYLSVAQLATLYSKQGSVIVPKKSDLATIYSLINKFMLALTNMKNYSINFRPPDEEEVRKLLILKDYIYSNNRGLIDKDDNSRSFLSRIGGGITSRLNKVIPQEENNEGIDYG